MIDAARRKAATFDTDARSRADAKIDVASTTPDYWLAFELARSVLGQTSYREVIREALAPATTAAIPHAYMQLWRLRLSGLINLNLDRLATRALTKRSPGIAPTEFTGHQSANWLRVLKSSHPFIINMHGVAEDASSWTLTKDELRQLFDTPGYDEFIVSCLSTRTVLFVGISVDDVAVGGHLERLAKRRVETGPHYWLTDRIDDATDEWAEHVGVSVIRYEAYGTNHSAIDEFFDDVLGFVPADDVPRPVTIAAKPVGGTLPPPRSLLREDADTIRTQLNACDRNRWTRDRRRVQTI